MTPTSPLDRFSAPQQERPTDAGSEEQVRRVRLGARIDISGQVFGELRVIRPLRSTQRGWEWECECLGCGDLVTRTAGSLRRSAKAGHTSSCKTCAQEVRLAILASMPKVWLRQMYAVTGSLYGSGDFGGDLAPLTAMPTGREGVSQDDRASRPWCLGYAEIARSEGGYVCAECHHVTLDAIGCIDCIEPICRACAGVHDCVSGESLAGIGAACGYSRERIQQLERGALAKVRRALDLLESEATTRRIEETRRAG